MNQRAFTAVYQKRGGHYIAWIEEVPGVNTQGATKQETKENLKDALSMILRTNRAFLRKQNSHPLTREVLHIGVPA